MNTLDSKAALERLFDGNRRFQSEKPLHPNRDPAHRRDQVAGQAPFAVILSCADSRIPPEILFDQGIGDLFVIRVAGNIIAPELLASVEYALAYLGTKLVVVLGHSGCGAVAAALAGGEPESPALTGLLARITPASVEGAREPHQELTEKAHVRCVVRELRTSEPIIAAQVRAGAEIIGGHYDQASGAVRLLPG